MIWNICLGLSITVLCLFAGYAFAAHRSYKSNRLLTPLNAALTGVALAIFIGLVPVISELSTDSGTWISKLFLLDIVQTMQVFTVNAGADLILDNINNSTTAISVGYSIYMACLFAAAPILTFSFLISLFRNALAGLFYRVNYRKDVYIFSELNRKALMLARDIRKNHPKALLVFTNAGREEEESLGEALETAKELKALVFQKDMISVNFGRHSKKAQLTFLAIAENERENVSTALKILDKYSFRENTGLYVFSSSAEGEMLLSNAGKEKVKLRRVNEVRSLVYHYLDQSGAQLFEGAKDIGGENKEIHVVILGLGKYGTEMLKALAWFGQMDGYSIRIDAFDRDELAGERIAALCPELMSDEYNGVHIPGESEYTIRIHSGVDTQTKTFAEQYGAIGDVTNVFVCLGEDSVNIGQAANIRMLSERFGYRPVIRAVVHSEDETKAVKGITNYRGQAYDIETFGDLETFYSEGILINSELERDALERHLKWGKEEEFWQYEYNYRSSMAAAVHMKARIVCGIPGASKKETELTRPERDAIEKLEHRRWNAYMRSEGYIYSGSPDKSSRNDLAKMHHDLVDFSKLNDDEKRKDSAVGTI